MYQSHSNNNALRDIEQQLLRANSELEQNKHKVQHVQNQLDQIERKIKILEGEKRGLDLELGTLTDDRAKIAKAIADDERRRADIISTTK